MIVFFDTSVHIAILRGDLSLESSLGSINGTVRMSPVVASELLRGAKGNARRTVKQLIDHLVPLEPPSWRRLWLEAGAVLRDVFADHEAVGLAQLQNDCLLALTAQRTGALLVTLDGHFTQLRRHRSFPLRLVAHEAR